MMTFADEIIHGDVPNIERYLQEGNSLEDVDEYGFTPLIECAIVGNMEAASMLLERGVNIDKPDVTGRTALHWAVDNNNMPLVKMLLDKKANANAYNRGGQPALVFPVLREQFMLKQVLYQHDASLDFAQDFINTKLIGHRYELSGDVDILNAAGEFIELDYEGFFLEFTIDVMRNSLSQFRSNFAARSLRAYFAQLCEIIYAFEVAEQMLKYQHMHLDKLALSERLHTLVSQPLLILPVAYRGHAITFVRYGDFWAKCDRGENSLKEGTVNIYYIKNKSALNPTFYNALLFQKQTERFVHKEINKVLGLEPVITLPVSQQISGNCSWANVEAVVPTAFMLQYLDVNTLDQNKLQMVGAQAIEIYEKWLTWDKDRALSECINSISGDISAPRKASKAAILGAVLFQSCDYGVDKHMQRAEKILKILSTDEYRYILNSYLEEYCVKRLTPRGNNLLKLLEDAGIDARIGVNDIATQLKKEKRRSKT
jgi:hypothetical protein